MKCDKWQAAALTIAGSDSGGNAGIQADLRTFHAFGVHGATAITALTAQNPWAVTAVQEATPEFLAQQLDAVLPHYHFGAVKTGMLAAVPLIEVVADRLARYPGLPKVIDPVMVATSGVRLLKTDAVATLCARLLPLATLITPNLPEAEMLLQTTVAPEAAAMAAAARVLAERFSCAVLLKGGHAVTGEACDVLHDAIGSAIFKTARVATPLSTHGTGCTLSAAVTAALAGGADLRTAVRQGKAYVFAAINCGRRVGVRATVLGSCAVIAPDTVETILL